MDQILLYILALFITALILFYGYRAIASLQNRAEEIALVRFEKSLQAKIETLASQYESVRIEEFDVPKGVDKVCFADEQRAPGQDTAELCKPNGKNYDQKTSPVVCDALTAKTDNVFLLPSLQNLKIKKVKLEGGTSCIPSKGGRIVLRLTGQGDGTSIETT
ncbi:hypothetical protein HY639_04130 [Candidatus Woesearchaeota archaeon]|nr:hypothetical protein [Candidatus Woesearchaeota archaeon]